MAEGLHSRDPLFTEIKRRGYTGCYCGVLGGHSPAALGRWLKAAHESGAYAMQRYASMLQTTWTR